jgi:hypothetical protein
MLKSERKQVALSKVDSWKRRDEIPKESLPGESYPNSALADACYTLLLAPKSAALKCFAAASGSARNLPAHTREPAPPRPRTLTALLLPYQQYSECTYHMWRGDQFYTDRVHCDGLH